MNYWPVRTLPLAERKIDSEPYDFSQMESSAKASCKQIHGRNDTDFFHSALRVKSGDRIRTPYPLFATCASQVDLVLVALSTTTATRASSSFQHGLPCHYIKNNRQLALFGILFIYM